MFLQIFRKNPAKIVGKGKPNRNSETQRYRLPQLQRLFLRLNGYPFSKNTSAFAPTVRKTHRFV